MPFYNNIYYPLPMQAQGAHSSAGIPSLLSSPQSVPSFTQSRPTGSAMFRILSCGTAAVPAPFKFRARRERVDWRQINTVDVNQVACELDFQTLQAHITAVTFCNIEGERCPCCQSQVDPALLKLFRLAQLTVEYLLHSQDCLTLSLQAAEERLHAEAQERDQLRAQLQKQNQDAKSLKEELKQRKKIIACQQAMITAGIANYHKCHHCEKAFLNASFLQSHMERRHPMEYDLKVMTDNQKKVQTIKLQEEINRLQEQLTLARSQMEMQQKDCSAKQEILMLQQSSKTQGMQTIQAQVNSNQNSEEQPLQEALQLQQKLHKQEIKWAAKMQNMKEEYEKSQLQAIQANVSRFDREAEMQRQIQELKLMLQEQRQIINFNSKQMGPSSSNPPTAVVQQEVVVPPAPEPKLKVVVSEQSGSVHKLDPIMELSQEDKDSSSISESLPDTQSWQKKVADLLKKPGLKRDMRMAVQESLHGKMLSLGIHPGVCELSNTAYKSAMAHVVSNRQQQQRENPVYSKVQKVVWGNLEQRLTKPQVVQAMAVAQSRPWSSSLPTTVTKVASGPSSRQQHITQPAHRTGTLSRTSTLVLYQNSDEDFSEEEESEEESPQAQNASHNKGPQVKTTTVKSQPRRAQLLTTLQAVDSPQALAPCSAAPQSSAQRPGVYQAPVVSVNRTEVTVVDSESEWTEGSEMEEISVKRLQKHTDQNVNIQKISLSNVKILTKNLEQQLADRGLKKTAESINTISGKRTEVLNTNNVVQELKYTEIDKDDDWEISLLEDIPAALKPSPASVRKCTDKSVDSSTSVWDTSTGKGQKPGLNDAGTGSTLKSSIVIVSDWDDSDDI
ncbi:cilium assembly protein DZIP1 isoform X6 [Salminus brasiliensis]|uniref:cilium assembly protein DZIP1 isoform X6 n=1 Tax=Salminus brasiliensis TaxID=930266 RepID=UPI003B82DE66